MSNPRWDFLRESLAAGTLAAASDTLLKRNQRYVRCGCSAYHSVRRPSEKIGVTIKDAPALTRRKEMVS